tara:strand:+ start:3011 stop:3307 length:297 start_codon:yes stop_codon:yes gene_type:complete
MSASEQFKGMFEPAQSARGDEQMMRVVLRAQEKHQQVRDQLESIVAMKDMGIRLGDDIEFEAGSDLHKGFLTGLQIALQFMGDFPLKVEEASDEEEDA